MVAHDNTLIGHSNWPRISIVTPSYNQCRYLEETIRSVIFQDYPNLEYIVMDGGSTDGSLELLHRYQSHFSYWTHAPDYGQADALARGFQRSTGEILGYLNSDDVLLPGALRVVANAFQNDCKTDLIVGKSILIDAESRPFYRVPGMSPTFYSLLFWGSGGFNQPASFWRRAPFIAHGLFDTNLRFAFDYDMYLRLTKNGRSKRIDHYLAAFRIHLTSKTTVLSDIRRTEDVLLKQRYGGFNYPVIIRKFAWLYYYLIYMKMSLALKTRSAILHEAFPALTPNAQHQLME